MSLPVWASESPPVLGTGEAAGQVSPTFRAAHPDIPWRDITGMRHRLIHGYAEVRMDIDQSGCHPLAIRVDYARSGRCIQVLADGFDAAVRDQHIRAIESRAGTG